MNDNRAAVSTSYTSCMTAATMYYLTMLKQLYARTRSLLDALLDVRSLPCPVDEVPTLLLEQNHENRDRPRSAGRRDSISARA